MYEVTIHYRDEIILVPTLCVPKRKPSETFTADSYGNTDGWPGVFSYSSTNVLHLIPWDLISRLEIKEIEDAGFPREVSVNGDSDQG